MLCSTPAQAAEFCHAEKLLKEPKKSAFQRLGPMPDRERDENKIERASSSYHPPPRYVFC